MSHSSRRLPVGAELMGDRRAHFRVWAPRAQRVEIVIEGGGDTSRAERAFEAMPEPDGYFAALLPDAAAGTLYRYRLDGGDRYPDPASRFQPDGPHGPSMVVDPAAFAWRDQRWPGVALEGQVVYEMHVGTFTPEGTFQSAARELAELGRIGITVVELMPVADFAGRFGWGYDGVNFFAPTRLYGTPDDLRQFVDEAHAVGIGVILDVVYNHLGPEGCYLERFSSDYTTERHTTDWGPAINYDGKHAESVREYVIANAGYWIDEFHMDGLRLDATQDVRDDSPEHVLVAIRRRVRDAAAGRHTIVVAENEPQHARLVRPIEAGGYGLDALWNDDFHHAAMVALTGRREAYYTDYKGTPQEFVSCARRGFLYQGQRYAWQRKPRGTATDGLHPSAFVAYTQNHDQVANSLRGLRSHALGSPARHRALTALLLLAPSTPMLFQGQEFAASSPFLFFSDLSPELAAKVRDGRGEFLRQFPSLDRDDVIARVPDPTSLATFARCKLDLGERARHGEAYALHSDLLALRRADPVFRAQRPVDGAVLGETSLVLRFFGEAGDDRLLLLSLGCDEALEPAPEPLLAPPEGRRWSLLWASEAPAYGGSGVPAVDPEGACMLLGESAVVLRPERWP